MPHVLVFCFVFWSVRICHSSQSYFCFYVQQKSIHDLQSAVDSLQKEKEELVLALQSAKKDTNQAKYERLKS